MDVCKKEIRSNFIPGNFPRGACLRFLQIWSPSKLNASFVWSWRRIDSVRGTDARRSLPSFRSIASTVPASKCAYIHTCVRSMCTLASQLSGSSKRKEMGNKRDRKKETFPLVLFLSFPNKCGNIEESQQLSLSLSFLSLPFPYFFIAPPFSAAIIFRVMEPKRKKRGGSRRKYDTSLERRRRQ